MDRWKHDDPCALIDDLARSLSPGLWINLLVSDPEASISFQETVLGCEVIYRDDAFAILRYGGTVWMLHSDGTYSGHPMRQLLGSAASRGTGCEIRLHGCDPDEAEARARASGGTVLATAEDKPHGLREAYLVDPDGYVWVPSVPKAESATRTAA